MMRYGVGMMHCRSGAALVLIGVVLLFSPWPGFAAFLIVWGLLLTGFGAWRLFCEYQASRSN